MSAGSNPACLTLCRPHIPRPTRPRTQIRMKPPMIPSTQKMTLLLDFFCAGAGACGVREGPVDMHCSLKVLKGDLLEFYYVLSACWRDLLIKSAAGRGSRLSKDAVSADRDPQAASATAHSRRRPVK